MKPDMLSIGGFVWQVDDSADAEPKEDQNYKSMNCVLKPLAGQASLALIRTTEYLSCFVIRHHACD